MRKISTFIFLGLVAQVGCGPSPNTNSPSIMRGSTGFFDKDGVDYLHGSDPYVEQRMADQEKQQAAPAVPATPVVSPPTGKAASPEAKTPPTAQTDTPKPVPAANALTSRVKEFQMKRFDVSATKDAEPARFGAYRYEITVFFSDQTPEKFTGKFTKNGSKFHVDAKSGTYLLTGDLTDTPERITAPLILTDTKTQNTIEISYRAFKARLKVLEDLDHPIAAGSGLRKQVDDLKVNTFGWVNNWTVLNGPGFYLVDLVKVTDPKKPDAGVGTMYAFSGESKRTAKQGESYEWDARSMTPESAPQVKLIGNSDQGSGRAFQLTVEDKDSKEKSELVVNIEADQPDETVQIKPDDIPDVDKNAPAPEEAAADSLPEAAPDTAASSGTATPAKPAPGRPVRTPVAPIIGDAYFNVNKSLNSTSGRMHAHYARTLNLPGVQAMIALFMKGERSRLQNFYDYAYPFRALAQKIADVLDVNPIYMYLATDESKYFAGGNYAIERGDGTRAYGPFQMWVPAAQDAGVWTPKYGARYDERGYFAPEACGAARYLKQQSNFSDMTLGLMGYNQGPKAHELSRRWGYTWADIDHYRAGASIAAITYVNRKLAIYFISNNRTYYRFPIVSGHERKEWSDRATHSTVMPPRSQPIHNAQCRSIVEPYLANFY